MPGQFEHAVLTQKGIALLAKAQAGECTIAITGAATGNGEYGESEDLTAMTALRAQKQRFPIDLVTAQNKTNVYVKFTVTNQQSGGNLQNGYYVKECGIFATDPDDGEILYAIATSDAYWDYMPAYNNLLPSTITIDFLAEVDNADTVTITAPNHLTIYDETTGDAYQLGIKDGLLYYQEVTT